MLGKFITGFCIGIALLVCFAQRWLSRFWPWGGPSFFQLVQFWSWDTLFQTFISKLPMNKPVQGQRCVFCVWNNEVFGIMKCWKWSVGISVTFSSPAKQGTYFPLLGIRNGLLIHPVVLFFLVRTQPLSCQSCLSMIPPHTTPAHTRTHTHTYPHRGKRGCSIRDT